jgi:SpoVK/Ycf46/Vps4 family AAA+-type ATPase
LAARAKAQALLAGRSAVDPSDVQAAGQGLEREDLDTLAVRLSAVGDWSHLVCSPHTRADLRLLEQRCRHRERLGSLVGEPLAGNLNAGVRALFKGPSGTGKTLAARLLAAALRQDIYRVDISAVVSKYIGETEKHLNRLFDRAESLDVILLFDEGDALFGRRTGVHNANDRYANLETNFLLQRIESYEGIVLVTTNLGEAIDRAFERRIDAAVEFRPPDAEERLEIWRLHLPPRHAVPGAVLEELAYRCALSGGQIRNGVLHASLLAVESGEPIRAGHLAAAVDREYRKTGSVCPLRPGVAAA